MITEGESSAVVRWRPEGTSPVDWSDLYPAPGVNPGFSEATSYLFTKPGDDWRLLIDDERLGGSPTDTGCWSWRPGFFAGEVTGELIRPDGRREALFLLDVAPDTKKMGRDTFSQMLSDLWSLAPELVIGSEPATNPIGNTGVIEDPWLAFARLRRYAADFQRALAQVRARPRRTLQVRRESAPLHHVRRVDRQTAAALLRSPALAVILDHDHLTTLASDNRLDVPVVEETLDCAANRAMAAIVLSVERRTRMICESLQELVSRENDSETRTSLAVRWPARKHFLDDFALQLRATLRKSPFRDVRRPEVTASGLTAIAADPVYARAWGLGWRALRLGIESPTTTERLWISPSWEIYERWCFMRVGQLLAAIRPAWKWQLHTNPHRWRGALEGAVGELLLQPTFGANRQNKQGMWSVSKQREPDIVLTVTKGQETQFVVLDAKYRATRANVLDAMESAHIYQDSLRIGPRRPESSVLVIPASGGAGWLEDPAFQAEHLVGAWTLAPGANAALPTCVTSLLSAG